MAGPRQLSLLDLARPLTPAGLKDEREFTAELAALVAEPVKIILTSNRSTLISVREGKGGQKTARVQCAFRAADHETMKALARFILKPDARSRRRIDAFLHNNQALIEAMARDSSPRLAARSAGRHLDLTRVLNKVRREYGIRVPGVAISWSSGGTRRKRRARRTIKFGSYCHRSKTIKIHPGLDSPDVPEFFVEYIVYHELLHALFPPVAGDGGRRDVHTAEFKRFEKKFPRYEEARKFEKLFVNTRLK
ncbi:MAG TPA: hypothetical protein VM658_10825 [bacterium]|nr:hypothetical protein [bacterium]